MEKLLKVIAIIMFLIIGSKILKKLQTLLFKIAISLSPSFLYNKVYYGT